MKPGAALPVWAIGLLTLASPASAYFEEVIVDARAISMGQAATATSSDVGAYYWNPAGLARVTRPEVLFDYGKPYAVPDLSASAMAVAFRLRDYGVAVAWHHFGVKDVYGEDRFSASVARAFSLPLDGHVLETGGTLKYGRVSFQEFTDPDDGESVNFGSRGRPSGDLGIRWVTPWKLVGGWMVRDLGEPRFELISGSGGGVVRSRHEFGLAYQWHPESILSLGRAQGERPGQSLVTAGIEITFYRVFSIRSGLVGLLNIPDPTTLQGGSDFGYTGGFGVLHGTWQLDFAAQTDRDYGASYRGSLKLKMPRKGGS